MKKRLMALLLLLGCAPLLSGCMVGFVNPLEKAAATPVPGLSMNLHAASASQSNVDVIRASLYYRFADQPLLAAESRSLTVPRDESMEQAIIKALLKGPTTGHSDLRRLLPQSVKVESVHSRDSTLFVTFNEAFLTDDGIPADWQRQGDWVSEAPLRRKLAVQSIVASITESFPYTGVQILVRKTSQTQTSLRLENAYFLSELTGLSEPQTRDETLLLTPRNTAERFLSAWQAGDLETLYAFVVNVENGEPKPSFQDVAQQLDAYATLSSFSLGSGSVSADGQHAVVTAELAMHQGAGSVQILGYPLPLVRENDIWKVTLAQLQRLMTL